MRGNGTAPNRTPRRRRQHRRARRSRHRLRAAAAALALLAAAGAAAFVLAPRVAADVLARGCTLRGRSAEPLGRTSFVYAANGTYLGAIRAETYRRVVPANEISPWLRKATVAIEDRTFWSNDGIDLSSIARAALADVRSGRIVEGGSTITQQLVRNLYLDDAKTFGRKRLEACLALRLTRAWPKQRILATYLNRVYYGHRAYGVEAASLTYFSRHARRLGPAQAALLAGLPQAPTRYDPFVHPAAALARRNRVLAAMRSEGMLSARAYAKARARRLGLHRGTVFHRRRAPTFFDFVRDRLVAAYGERAVRRGGLHVTTTLVPRDQALAHRAIRETLGRPHDPAAAVASVDPRTGAITALVSVDRRPHSTFNLAVSGRRQAGSSFKTFVLAEAIRRGANPYSTRYRSAPFTYRGWTPHTYERSYAGVETLAEATLRSDNIVFAKLTLDVGPKAVARLAHRMGVTAPLDPVPSIGLGANAVSPLDMASGYATLAAGGVYRKPFAIRKVVLPDGTVDRRWGHSHARRVLPRSVAYWVTRVLQENVARGTGTAAQIGRLQAGKTGTTDRWTDAWFVGYTRRVSTAVWVGYPRAAVPMTNVHGIHVVGGSFPARIWARYEKRALHGTHPAQWLAPIEPMQWRPWRGDRRYVMHVPRRHRPKPPAHSTPKEPRAHDAWIVVLGSYRARDSALARAHARALRTRGVQAWVALSKGYAGLRPGYAVVYGGSFSSTSAAHDQLRRLRKRFPRAYVRHVAF